MLITIGHSEITKIMNTSAWGTSDSAARPMGNQARGETGRRSCTRGFAAWNARRLPPISNPRGIATTAAMAKPTNTRWTDINSRRAMPLSLGPLS